MIRDILLSLYHAQEDVFGRSIVTESSPYVGSYFKVGNLCLEGYLDIDNTVLKKETSLDLRFKVGDQTLLTDTACYEPESSCMEPDTDTDNPGNYIPNIVDIKEDSTHDITRPYNSKRWQRRRFQTINIQLFRAVKYNKVVVIFKFGHDRITNRLADLKISISIPIGLIDIDRESVGYEKNVKLMATGPRTHKFCARLYINCNFKKTNNPAATDRDVTHIFKILMEQATKDLGKDIIAKKLAFHKRHPLCEEFCYIFVPGFLTEFYPTYFSENFKMMNQLDLHYELAPLSTVATVNENAKVLYEFCREIYRDKGMRIVLIGHSKGGVDALQAILSNLTDMKEIIFALISMQSPFHGTSLADYAEKYFFHNLKKILKPLDVNSKFLLSAIHGVSTKSRLGAIDCDDSLCLNNAIAPIKLLTLASIADFDNSITLNIHENMSKSSMFLLDEINQKFGFLSDGLVTLQDGRLPAGDVILLDDMFHTNPGLHLVGAAYHTGALTQALLDLLFSLNPASSLTNADSNVIGYEESTEEWADIL